MDTINVEERDLALTPKELRQARKKNQIPGAVYGKDVASRPIFLKTPAKRVASWRQGKHFKLKVDGKSMLATVEEIQKNPVTQDPLHVSLHTVSSEQELKVDVPILIKGEAKGDKKGGIVTQTKKTLGLKGKFKDLPEEIEVDVSELDVNEHLEVKDISLPQGVELLEDNPEQNVVVCSYSNVSLESDTSETTPEETETSGPSADVIQ